MVVKVVTEVDRETGDEAWRLYYAAFRELDAYAVQRHLMYRHEFDDVMRDPRIEKYLCLDDDGTLCGVATYTNHLEAWPLLSTAYFARRWPQLYAEGRIWWCGFVAVHPESRHRGVFSELVESMYITAAAENGIIGIDMCRFNDEARRLSRAVPLMLQRMSGQVRTERMDDQSYWMYEFPVTTVTP